MGGTCVLCGTPTRLLRHPVNEERYHACPNCGFIRKSTQDLISLEQEFNIYRHHNNSIEDAGYVGYLNDFIDRAVCPFAGDGRDGLDFGSGPSPVLARLLERDHGYRMDCYDLFFANGKTYEGKKYDLITCTEVIEHLRDPLAYFRLFRTLLKADGVLAIMTLFHPEEDDAFFHWFYIRDKSHKAFYTPATLQVLADMSGFKLINTDRHRQSTFRPE